MSTDVRSCKTPDVPFGPDRNQLVILLHESMSDIDSDISALARCLSRSVNRSGVGSSNPPSAYIDQIAELVPKRDAISDRITSLWESWERS